ncbi:MAG TPA: iron ABC transporter permease [Kofleriaceae bacterium]|nr:iron ABC transporter permease [Kofleriaceae bacterium]
MSGFVSSATPTRLTAQRLATVLGSATLLLALLAVLAPLLGVTADAHGRHLSLLSTAAFDPSSTENAILWVRIPRVLACLLVGAALGASGAGLQAILRNPLAEPFTLGISSGSALAAVIAIRIGVETWLGAAGVGFAALLGAGATLLVVWRLARTEQRLPAATLVLAGVTVSMFCSAASVLIQYTSDFSEVSRMLRWMMGGLESMRLSTVGWAAAPIVVGIATLIAFTRELNALAAGEEAAASVGVAVARTQSVVFIVASLLVGVSIAVAGPIGFVGLIVPHAIRGTVGPDHRLLVPASALGGAALLLICDSLARMVAAPAQLPAGAVTAVLGGPFFIFILVGHKWRANLWGRS